MVLLLFKSLAMSTVVKETIFSFKTPKIISPQTPNDNSHDHKTEDYRSASDKI